jgi:putative transposase
MTRVHSAGEIVAKLRLVDEVSSIGRTVENAVQAIGVTEVTYYRWKKRYGGLESDVVEWLMELEAENGRLRRAVSELTLDKLVLMEVLNGKCLKPALRRTFVDNVRAVLGVSERRACRVLGQHRSTQRKVPKSKNDGGHDNGPRHDYPIQHGSESSVSRKSG